MKTVRCFICPLTLSLSPFMGSCEKIGAREGKSTAHVQWTEKFACQNEAVLSLLSGVNSNFGYARR